MSENNRVLEQNNRTEANENIVWLMVMRQYYTTISNSGKHARIKYTISIKINQIKYFNAEKETKHQKA